LIPFVKAHACGNDFLIVETEFVPEEQRRETAVRLCARNTGVGADGVEYVTWEGEEPPRIHLFNADGSTAEISGNGTRCVAAWIARAQSLSAEDSFCLATDAGGRECRVVREGARSFEIAIGMGIPKVAPGSVVLASGARIEGAVVSMGNPHFVIFVDDESFSVAGESWETVGRQICFHGDFPAQTNVEFVHAAGPEDIAIRIFERGVGPTFSSGTGTCASAAAAIALRGLSSRLLVLAPGGAQVVEWQGGEAEMTLTGAAELIAAGEAF
jgi:diaminopimelate epimerase